MSPSQKPAGHKRPSAAKRLALTRELADIALEEGLSALNLRPVAERLGTSDRMLLYYFGTKAELVAAVLASLTERLTDALNLSKYQGRKNPPELLADAAALFAQPQTLHFMKVWLEVVTLAARHEEPYRLFARQSVAIWLQWLDDHLAIPDSVKRSQLAAAILTVLEGVAMLEIAHPGSTNGVAATLTGALASPAVTDDLM